MDHYKVEVVHDNRTIMVDEFTTLQDISKEYTDFFGGKIMAARINNKIKQLTYKICEDCQVEFLDITTSEGMRIYQRSATLIMSAAVNAVLG